MTHCPEGQVLQTLFYKQGNGGPEKLGHTATGGKGVPKPKGSPNGHVLHPLLLTCHPSALWEAEHGDLLLAPWEGSVTT